MICLASCAGSLFAVEQPNIVHILADDLGYGDLGCYNPRSKIPTPRLDRLAAEGMRFTDAHSPSSVCTPTRYALFTGRFAWRTRLQRNVLGPWDNPLITPDRMTVGKLLQQQGYTTACIGKPLFERRQSIIVLGENLPSARATGFSSTLPAATTTVSTGNRSGSKTNAATLSTRTLVNSSTSAKILLSVTTDMVRSRSLLLN